MTNKKPEYNHNIATLLKHEYNHNIATLYDSLLRTSVIQRPVRNDMTLVIVRSRNVPTFLWRDRGKMTKSSPNILSRKRASYQRFQDNAAETLQSPMSVQGAPRSFCRSIKGTKYFQGMRAGLGNFVSGREHVRPTS